MVLETMLMLATNDPRTIVAMVVVLVVGEEEPQYLADVGAYKSLLQSYECADGVSNRYHCW